MNLKQKLKALERWFSEKSHLISLTYFYSRRRSFHPLMPRMGDVYLAKLGINVGSETNKLRPVLVFQGKDKYLRFSGTVFVFPISSNIEKKRCRVLFEEDDVEAGRVKQGSILVQQGRTISTFRLGHKMGRIKIKKLIEIKHMFNKFLYKQTPLEDFKPRGGQGHKSSG